MSNSMKLRRATAIDRTCVAWRWVCFFIVMLSFLLLSHLLSREMFGGGVSDAFVSQIASVESNADLGPLAIMHYIRFFIVLPFLLVNNPLFDPAIFFCYVGFFLLSKRREIRMAAILCLFFSLFFSYRTVFVMLSVALFFQFAINAKEIKKGGYFVSAYAILLSFLSTASLGVVLYILMRFRSDIFNLGRWYKIIFYFSLAVIFLAFSHKVLFFSDAEMFGSAGKVSIEALIGLDFSMIEAAALNMIERSLLIESCQNGSSRLYVIGAYFILVFLMLTLVRNKDAVSFAVLFFFGLFTEGLLSYSLMVVISVMVISRIKITGFRFRHCSA